jgi:hypothetical protein
LAFLLRARERAVFEGMTTGNPPEEGRRIPAGGGVVDPALMQASGLAVAGINNYW